jgi:hypothetical protein
MTLGDYLKAATAHQWQPGVHDCCTLPGDWATTWGLGDPVAEWRGQYRSDAQAIRFINRAGGLLSLWDRGLGSIGVAPVNEPIAGDVGVVIAATRVDTTEHVGAVFTGQRWAYRLHQGLFFTPAVAVRCWGPR